MCNTLHGLSPSSPLPAVNYYLQDHSAGSFAVGGPTSVVLELTGVPPESFEAVVQRHMLLPPNRRSFENTLRTFWRFMITPFMPGVDAKSFASRLDMPPGPAAPKLAVDDVVWKAAHSPGKA